MKKRLTAVFLALVLCLGLTANTFAVTEEDKRNMLVFDVGTQVEETYPADIDAKGTGWTWTGSTRSFTMHNAQIDTTVSLPEGTTVYLEGDNFIRNLDGHSYSINGTGSLTANHIMGNVIFRSSGNIKVNEYIGNSYIGGYHIRIESGTITAPSICEGIYGATSDPPDEIVITGGTINLGSFLASDTDVTITGGTIYVDSNSTTRFNSSMAAFKIGGRYRNGKMIGGHFNFLGGTLSIDGKGRMALMTEIGFQKEDQGSVSSVPVLIQLGNGVSVVGGVLCSSLVLDGYIPNVANAERYAAYSFSEDGQPFKYYWETPQKNYVTTLTLSGSEQKADQALLWEPTYDSSSAAPAPTPTPTPTPTPSGISVTVGGKAVTWTDAEPFIDANDRTMVPLRAVADAMSLGVNWDAAAREASFTDGTKTIIFPIDSTTARTSDGGSVNMDTAAVISNDRTYAPIRYLAEFFGYTVGWDAATKTVSIT